MCDVDSILRDIYTSDSILIQDEEIMLENLYIRYFDLMDQFHGRIKDGCLVLSVDEVDYLEDSINEFVFEYGFIQFKRGIHLASVIEQV